MRSAATVNETTELVLSPLCCSCWISLPAVPAAAALCSAVMLKRRAAAADIARYLASRAAEQGRDVGATRTHSYGA